MIKEHRVINLRKIARAVRGTLQSLDPDRN